ncbi:MAG: hypothetical protein ACP5KA_00725 [Desulfurococcaceae archaeon]
MAYVKRVLAAALFVAVLASITGVPTALAEEGLHDTLVVIYAPRANLTQVREMLGKYNISHVLLRADLEEPAPSLYVAWALTGRRARSDVTLLDIPEEARNATYTMWSNATLIDVPFIDPLKHPYAVNPIQNFTLHIPPALFSVPVNGSTYLSTLNTTVSATLVGERLELFLDKYNITLVSANITSARELGPRKLKMNTTYGELEYYVSFYVTKASESSIEILFPGALPTTGIASPGINPVDGLLVHWYMPLVAYRSILANLTSDAAEWWIARSIDASLLLVTRGVSDTNTTVYHIYMPHAELAMGAVERELFSKVVGKLSEAIASVLYFSVLPKKPGALVVVISFDNTTDNVLFAGRIRNAGNIAADLTMSQLIGLVLSYSRALPLDHSTLLEGVKKLKSVEEELKNTKSQLTATELELNSTKSQLSACRAELDVAQSRLVNVEELEKTAKNMLTTAQLYMSMGLTATLALSALMGILAYRAAIKREVARKK